MGAGKSRGEGVGGEEVGLKRRCPRLAGEAEDGINVEGRIELRTNGGLGGDYEKAAIISRMYELDQVPEEETLLQQLHQMADIYSEV